MAQLVGRAPETRGSNRPNLPVRGRVRRISGNTLISKYRHLPLHRGGKVAQEVQLEGAGHVGVRVADVGRAAPGVRVRVASPGPRRISGHDGHQVLFPAEILVQLGLVVVRLLVIGQVAAPAVEVDPGPAAGLQLEVESTLGKPVPGHLLGAKPLDQDPGRLELGLPQGVGGRLVAGDEIDRPDIVPLGPARKGVRGLAAQCARHEQNRPHEHARADFPEVPRCRVFHVGSRRMNLGFLISKTPFFQFSSPPGGLAWLPSVGEPRGALGADRDPRRQTRIVAQPVALFPRVSRTIVC